MSRGDMIRLDRAFPESVRKSMLYVHLYFVKLFGCLIRENGIPISLDGFSQAILNNTPHDHVFIALWGDTGFGSGISDVHVDIFGGNCVFAAWFYGITPLTVNIMYSAPGQKRKGLIGAWHPTSIQKRIRVVGR